MPTSEADIVTSATIHALRPLHARVHTLTRDNDSEFAEQAVIDTARDTRSYFAASYSS